MFFHCTLLLQIRTSRTRLSLLSPYPSHYIASANVVGFNNGSYNANQNYIVGVQWEKVNNDGLIKFDDLMKPTQIGLWDGEDDTLNGAPMIMAVVNGTYQYYYYISNATDEDDEEIGYDCWADSEGYILPDTKAQSIGNGFWIRFSQTGEAAGSSFCGQVDNGETFSIDVPKDTNKLVCNPFPATLTLNDITFTDGIVPGEWDGEDDTLNGAPMIMAVVNGTYQYYYYISNATDEDDEEVGYNCWADSEGYILPESKNPAIGTGFWIRCAKNGKMVFKGPLAK